MTSRGEYLNNNFIVALKKIEMPSHCRYPTYSFIMGSNIKVIWVSFINMVLTARTYVDCILYKVFYLERVLQSKLALVTRKPLPPI